jgi:tRNA threonylcarbamoyladenosine biosynthesis protein TsaB
MIFEKKNNTQAALAIETSSRIGSVALGFGDKIVGEASFSGFMKHSAEIFPAINKLLSSSDIKPNQLEHIYISNGPGSFTGLRIAATIAKMMFLANQVEIVTVDSLDITAFNSLDAIRAQNQSEKFTATDEEIKKVASVLDAKRGQFFIALYDVIRNDDGFSLDKRTDDLLMSASEFCDKIAAEGIPVWLLGDGLLYYREEFKNENINFLEEKYWSPRAACVYQLGRIMTQKHNFADPVKFKPNYLYRPEIVTKQR